MIEMDQSNDQSINATTPSKTVDFFTLVNPIELIVDWVSNYEFYCMLPSLSKSQCALMHNDSLHRQQCKQRLPMTDFQFQLFQQSRFPLLYISLSEIDTIADAREKLSKESKKTTETLDKASATAAKSWWLECTRLFLHLSYATMQLTWIAPRQLAHPDGNFAQIKYVLPRLIQSILIDELTSFYVFNLLRRYQDDGYHNNIMFDEIKYSESTLQQYQDVIKVFRNSWEDYSKMEDTDDFDEDSDVWNEVSRFSDDNEDRLMFLFGECCMLGDSPANGCGAYEYSQYLWFGPALKAASDKMSALSHCPSYVYVDMSSAVPVNWDMKNGEDGPPRLLENLHAWFLNGGMSNGQIKQRERVRLYKFMYGDAAHEHYKLNLTEAKKEQIEDAKPVNEDKYGSETTYGNICSTIERSSDWWSQEQILFSKLVDQSTNQSTSDGKAEEDVEEDDADKDDYEDNYEQIEKAHKNHPQAELFEKYLHHVFCQHLVGSE